MNTVTITRRMPVKYWVRPGVTEVIYNATTEVVVILPGTRWLEKRREREALLLVEAEALAAEAAAAPLSDEELTELASVSEEDATAELPCIADEAVESEPQSWTDLMRIASTQLVRRQTLSLASLRNERASLQLASQD